MTVDRVPAIASFPVPGDAASINLWFLNIGYVPFCEPPKAWDSHFGDNYVFTVRPKGTAQPVAPRTDARAARYAVNAMQLAIETERHQSGDTGAGIFAGWELQTHAKLTVWVSNIA